MKYGKVEEEEEEEEEEDGGLEREGGGTQRGGHKQTKMNLYPRQPVIFLLFLGIWWMGRFVLRSRKRQKGPPILSL